MLTSLLLATPVFGLALVPPDVGALQLSASVIAPAMAAPSSAPFAPTAFDPAALPNDGEWGEDWDGKAPNQDGKPEEASDENAEASADGSDPGSAGDADKEAKKALYAAEVRERAELGDIHRVLGIATWGAMTASVALGTIQYYNLYGFGSGRDTNPCVEGSAVFGQGQCSGTPWLHLGSGLLTAGLYSATFALSLAMPDPNDLANSKGAYAEKMSLHKTLRWVHFGGMVAQMLLGFVIANPDTFGMDRTNDYGTLQALATVHLGAGLVTWGAMTWAGALFTF